MGELTRSILSGHAGDDSGKGLLSDTQKQILYTFDALGTYGEDLQLEVSPVEVEALLRQCSEMLRKLTTCKIPISVDTWTGLGKIRWVQACSELDWAVTTRLGVARVQCPDREGLPCLQCRSAYHLVLEGHDFLQLILPSDCLGNMLGQWSSPCGRQILRGDAGYWYVTDCLGMYHDTDPSRGQASDQP